MRCKRSAATRIQDHRAVVERALRLGAVLWVLAGAGNDGEGVGAGGGSGKLMARAEEGSGGGQQGRGPGPGQGEDDVWSSSQQEVARRR
jgi:hypothetical protein